MKGYKALHEDMTAINGEIVYEIGNTYEHNGPIVLCESGFHFCTNPINCFTHYPQESRLFEIEAHGTIVFTRAKSACSRITIVREIDGVERTELLNSGTLNSGIGNSGCHNSGDWNSGWGNNGDYNSGHTNSGHYNSGHWNGGAKNSGNLNSGSANSGDYNSGYGNSGEQNGGDYNSGCNNNGNWNSGHYNRGNWNSGDWNYTDYSSGILCTEETECLIFDKPSGITLRMWRGTNAANLMRRIETPMPYWLDWDEMTDGEQERHPEAEAPGGMLVVPDNVGVPDFAGWWAGLSGEERDIIKAIPNFDAGKWKLITGIEV